MIIGVFAKFDEILKGVGIGADNDGDEDNSEDGAKDVAVAATAALGASRKRTLAGGKNPMLSKSARIFRKSMP